MWILSLVATMLLTPHHIEAILFPTQTQLFLEASANKKLNESCLLGAFKTADGRVEECLEHCMENCLCQSFQICKNKDCQLCSRNKTESEIKDNQDCTVFFYERTETFESLDDRCFGACSKWPNCCQQAGLCLNNGTCQPSFSNDVQTRFTCQCPEGFHGVRCEQPIKSCQAYAKGSRLPGLYKVLDSNFELYKVYCDFEQAKTWTLVESYSVENSTISPDAGLIRIPGISRALFENFPVRQDSVSFIPWQGYRLSKGRMQSIQDDSSFLRFTCDFETHRNASKSDFVQFSIKADPVDVIELHDVYKLTVETIKVDYEMYHDCLARLVQLDGKLLHVKILTSDGDPRVCDFRHLDAWSSLPGASIDDCKSFRYFGNYNANCVDPVHRCALEMKSTTQIWFGH